MPQPVYFDTSVFLEILVKKSKLKDQIRELLEELKDEKVRIYTSILTIQEASVLTFKRGRIAYDNYAEINKMARIWGIDKRIALTAAKREAEIRELSLETSEESEQKQRRRRDCFHIASAQVLECSHLYTTDVGMMKRKKQLGIDGLEIVPPEPRKRKLEFPAQIPMLIKAAPQLPSTAASPEA